MSDSCTAGEQFEMWAELLMRPDSKHIIPYANDAIDEVLLRNETSKLFFGTSLFQEEDN